MSSSPHRVAIIGAGFGGLAAGIRLQAAGCAVTIFEALEQVGGRAGHIVDQGYVFDMGPTIITAPHLLRELWGAAGRTFDDDVELMPLNPYYRIYFPDGQFFDYGGNEAETEEQIAKFNREDVNGYKAFLVATKNIYERAFEDLARQPFLTVASMLKVLPELIRLGAVRSVYSYASQFIQHPRLRTIFSFHPLFIGGSPLRASAIYSVIPYLERMGGVHFARGGMNSLVKAMSTLFTSLGGEIRLNAPIEQIILSNGRVSGVLLADGSTVDTDAVVSNADAQQTYTQLVPRSARKKHTTWRFRTYRYSMSCYLLYFGVRRTYDKLAHHTVLMPDRYAELIREVFDGRGLPKDLSLYLHAPTKSDKSLAPPGCESLYVLAPVPHLGRGVNWREMDQRFRDRIVRYLEHEFGLEDLEANIAVERRFTPRDFATRLRSWRGSAFSIEPTLAQSAYFRPHNRSGDVPGLYLVGAGTHPGAGLPGALLTADITAKLVLEDRPASCPEN
jgi:phytoene desaturase